VFLSKLRDGVRKHLLVFLDSFYGKLGKKQQLSWKKNKASFYHTRMQQSSTLVWVPTHARKGFSRVLHKSPWFSIVLLVICVLGVQELVPFASKRTKIETNHSSDTNRSKSVESTLEHGTADDDSEADSGVQVEPEHPYLTYMCWESAVLIADPQTYSSIPEEYLSDLKQSGQGAERLPLTLNSDDVPYIFVVPALKGACPVWFTTNMESTVYVQNTESGVEVPQKVILVEGGNPGCAEWCTKNGATHVSLPDKDIERYWGLIRESYPANFAMDWDQTLTDHRNNLWLQSIMRYFMLNQFVQSSGLQKFVYLDWDTTVYIPSREAWTIMQKAHVQIASCIYPPFSTANNIYVMFTRQGLRSFVDFVCASILTQMSLNCTQLPGTPGRIITHDMDHILQYFAHQFRRDIRPQQDWSSWMDNAAVFNLANVQGCNDENVTCGEDVRWRYDTASTWGQLYPPWKFRPPEYSMFNLCEPFGNGNVVSELPWEGVQKVGTEGYKSLDRALLTHTLWDYTQDGAKTLTWNEGRPYLSRLKPEDGAAPIWGWFNDVEAMRTEDPPQHFFRVWAVHFAVHFKSQLPSHSAKARGLKPSQ
jgi:hypothetical protein